MSSRAYQTDAAAASRRALTWFVVMLLALALAVGGLAWLAARLLHGPDELPLQMLALGAGLVVAAVMLPTRREHRRLRAGGAARVVRFAGGRLLDEPTLPREKLVLMLCTELANQMGVAPPAVYLLDEEHSINGLAIGAASDAAIALTRGALEHLRIDELQGVVAQLLAQVASGAAQANMSLLPMAWGLAALHSAGRSRLAGHSQRAYERRQERAHEQLVEPGVDRAALAAVLNRHEVPGPIDLACGWGLMLLGWPGWLAALVLQSKVCERRVHAFDSVAARAVGRRSGLGNTLRKLIYAARYAPSWRQRALVHPQADLLAPLLLHSPPTFASLPTHPSLSLRLKHLYGRERSPLLVPAWDRRDGPARDGGQIRAVRNVFGPMKVVPPTVPQAPQPRPPLRPVAPVAPMAPATTTPVYREAMTLPEASPPQAPAALPAQELLAALNNTMAALQALLSQQPGFAGVRGAAPPPVPAQESEPILAGTRVVPDPDPIPIPSVAVAAPEAAIIALPDEAAQSEPNEARADALPAPSTRLPLQGRQALSEQQQHALARLYQLRSVAACGCAMLAMMLSASASRRAGTAGSSGAGPAGDVAPLTSCEAEIRVWNEASDGVPQARSVLIDMQDIPPPQRPQLLHHLLTRLAAESASERLVWLDAARQLMRCPDRVDALDRLWWLLLTERLGRRPHVAQAVIAADALDADGMPPRQGSGLTPRQCMHVATFTALLAHVVPSSTPTGEVGAHGEAWYYAVMARVTAGPIPHWHLPPEVLAFADSLWDSAGPGRAAPVLIDASTQALWSLLELPAAGRAQVLSVWVDEAARCAAGMGLSSQAADALRLAALLLDVPQAQAWIG